MGLKAVFLRRNTTYEVFPPPSCPLHHSAAVTYLVGQIRTWNLEVLTLTYDWMCAKKSVWRIMTCTVPVYNSTRSRRDIGKTKKHPSFLYLNRNKIVVPHRDQICLTHGSRPKKIGISFICQFVTRQDILPKHDSIRKTSNYGKYVNCFYAVPISRESI